MLQGWLDWHRQTLLTKCAGLTAEQLKTASAEPSNLTLLGLVRHLTEVERWFRGVFTGEATDDSLYSSEASPEGALTDLADADAEADLATYRAEIELARAGITDKRDLDELYDDSGDGGGPESLNLRWVYFHMIEEYARHNGHADLIRERIDGVTGD